MTRTRAIVLIGFAAAALGACGKQGDLERPAPRGHQAQTAAPADAANRTAAATEHNTGPGPTTRDNNPAPNRSVPLEGTRPDPFAGPPPSAFPDPYNNPP